MQGDAFSSSTQAPCVEFHLSAPPPGTAAAALAALCTLARYHEIAADPETLAYQLGLAPHDVVDTPLQIRAAKQLGFQAKLCRIAPERLPATPLPALAVLKSEARSCGRVVILAQCDALNVLLQDPASVMGRPVVEPLTVFLQKWSGDLILLATRASLTGDLARFDFSWFIPSLMKYRKLLAEVLWISCFLQLFALISPLFFQVVMDKVLVHRGVRTLDVLVIGLIVVAVSESILTGLRSYILSHTTSRIDVELGARLFRHLTHLPLAYFQSRRVGDSVARVRELENIRAFLTGNAVTVLLDVVFASIFIAVMFVYSIQLTLIVLASVPLYFSLCLIIVPILRKRLDIAFARGAESQAMLVETISAIQTVKATALEPAFAKRWDNQLAAYVSAGFKVHNLTSWAQAIIHLINQLVSASTLWLGAHQVMDNRLTLGQFVAFNMFAQRVANPIMRMAQLWTEFQQTSISMDRLGDILNTRTEVPQTTVVQLPSIQGRITLENISFRYRPEAALALNEISLEVQPGDVVGIVGRSGSGKSTLAKLIQRLYIPEQGRLLIDDIDIHMVDAAQLRRQVGVVLQESLLFNRSVRENIAIVDPAAPLEKVMLAARLAGAHDFISALPEGYDAILGEQGTGLSGGQRQRIAIARALFQEPRILIFDEATSALDYESESIIQRNMAQISHGRTVIIIAHRLSAVRNANRIIVMEKGRIVEEGAHAALLANHGFYARLWAMQTGAPQPMEAKHE